MRLCRAGLESLGRECRGKNFPKPVDFFAITAVKFTRGHGGGPGLAA